jgi:hypothetical protein
LTEIFKGKIRRGVAQKQPRTAKIAKIAQVLKRTNKWLCAVLLTNRILVTKTSHLLIRVLATIYKLHLIPEQDILLANTINGE